MRQRSTCQEITGSLKPPWDPLRTFWKGLPKASDICSVFDPGMSFPETSGNEHWHVRTFCHDDGHHGTIATRPSWDGKVPDGLPKHGRGAVRPPDATVWGHQQGRGWGELRSCVMI